MSLEDWLRKDLLTEHQTDRQEIGDLLAAADRDLHDCTTEGLSADWRLAIAHNAVRGLATAALAAAGYRPGRGAHHYRAVQSLAHTISAEAALVYKLDALRKKRNVSEYERAGSVSEHEADMAVLLARRLRERVTEWLQDRHPDLLGSPEDASVQEQDESGHLE